MGYPSIEEHYKFNLKDAVSMIDQSIIALLQKCVRYLLQEDNIFYNLQNMPGTVEKANDQDVIRS